MVRIYACRIPAKMVNMLSVVNECIGKQEGYTDCCCVFVAIPKNAISLCCSSCTPRPALLRRADVNLRPKPFVDWYRCIWHDLSISYNDSPKYVPTVSYTSVPSSKLGPSMELRIQEVEQ